jgi:alcohol dehydrogenase class IV
MNSEFDFQTAGRILFGTGKSKSVGQICRSIGKNAVLLVGNNGQIADEIKSILAENGITYTIFSVSGEPNIATAVNAAQSVIDNKSDMVVGCGGGSVLDTAKACAALAMNPGDPFDYLEVVGKGQRLSNDPLPVIAIPTTAGTGSEVTRNAVLSVPDQQVKVSLRDARMLPAVAIVDPLLTLSVPPDVTASTGMDALTQVIEPYVSVRANPFTDSFCEAGIRRAGRSLFRAYKNGEDLDAREDMAFCSLIGGLALANAGLGAVHGFAAPIGGMFSAPHGAICARLLPPVCKMNIRELKKHNPGSPILDRYLRIAHWLSGDPKANLDELIDWLEQHCYYLCIPGLSAYGITTEDMSLIVDKTMQASSYKANPIKLEKKELLEILESAL